MRLLKAALVAFFVGLLVAGIPLYLELRNAESAVVTTQNRLTEETTRLERELAMSNLHSDLGLLLFRVEQGDFERARQVSTRVFNQADALAAQIENADDRRRIQTLVQQRDAITSGLATGDASTTEALRRLYELLSTSVENAGR